MRVAAGMTMSYMNSTVDGSTTLRPTTMQSSTKISKDSYRLFEYEGNVTVSTIS